MTHARLAPSRALLVLMMATSCRPGHRIYCTAALLTGITACDLGRPAPPAERALEARLSGLRGYSAASATPMAERELVPFPDAVILIRESLIQRIAQSTLPVEAVIKRRYRVRIERAEVTLEPGVVLLGLVGRASLVADTAIYADIDLLGVLEIGPSGGDVSSGGDGADAHPLAGRIRVLGVDTRRVGVAGLSPPARRLVDGLARVRQRDLTWPFQDLPIPVRLDERIEIRKSKRRRCRFPEARSMCVS